MLLLLLRLVILQLIHRVGRFIIWRCRILVLKRSAGALRTNIHTPRYPLLLELVGLPPVATVASTSLENARNRWAAVLGRGYGGRVILRDFEQAFLAASG